jgi:hypothetical protein
MSLSFQFSGQQTGWNTGQHIWYEKTENTPSTSLTTLPVH